MAKVTIYTTNYCGYCHAAKRLLDQLSVDYDERDVTNNPGARAELVGLAEGRTTVPQIFIGERSIGGYTDLAALHDSGRLKAMLAD
ncbi:MAG: glutaredoxin 3 [Myxococcales bacterium]|nr:glutaredoxin 3 [Myxococcales bacterium]